MIQRIQTFYLTVATILIGILAWIEMGVIALGNEVFSFNVFRIVETNSMQTEKNMIETTILAAIIVLLQFVIIFSYKKRVLQMRLSTYNIILMLGLIALSWYKPYSLFHDLGVDLYAYKIPMAFPLVAIILNYLAIRSIGKDEALVRSVDRIR